MKKTSLTFKAQKEDTGMRIDKVLPLHFPQYTRQYFQKLLKEGLVLVKGKALKPSSILQEDDILEITVPALQELNLEPKNIPLDIIFEDEDMLVVNKQAGLVTHPGAGNSHADDSLVNAILYHCKGKLSGISGVMRPGIVHRLDKDTSGVMVVAKNDKAHQNLAEQLKNHEMEKMYLALVAGHLDPARGSIDAPIGRSSVDRKKMAIVEAHKGKKGLTHYEVIEYIKTDFPIESHYSLIKVQIMTGRTHQIRVHFAGIGHPVVGDRVYGREKINELFSKKFNLQRQFLHAQKLTFQPPGSKKRATFEAALPVDLQNVIDNIKR